MHPTPTTKKWKRRSYGRSTNFGIRKDSEIEIDRDMEKPLEQIACDIHETLFNMGQKI
jgi:hypothetical protein